MPIKLYCYVDESGQDTQGRLFVVAAIVTEKDRDLYRTGCESAELESQRGREKWSKSRPQHKTEYIRLILGQPIFNGHLFYATYKNTTAYHEATAQTIALVLGAFEGQSQNAVVIIDALPKSLQIPTRQQIKHFGVRVDKVRGVQKDENEALIRLADAICGLVRDALKGQVEYEDLLDQAIHTGIIRDVSPDH